MDHKAKELVCASPKKKTKVTANPRKLDQRIGSPKKKATTSPRKDQQKKKSKKVTATSPRQKKRAPSKKLAKSADKLAEINRVHKEAEWLFGDEDGSDTDVLQESNEVIL